MTLPRPLEQINRQELKYQVAELARGESIDFDLLAKQIYQFQYKECKVYRTWVDALNKPSPINIEQLPRLHISAWKYHQVVSGVQDWQQIYTSSGTTDSQPSKHYVSIVDYYLDNAVAGFEAAYGPVEQYCFLGLLPAYMERQGSSLVAMVQEFIRRSAQKGSGTYLYDHEALSKLLQSNRDQAIPTVLIGVSFGLLDFVEHYQIDFPELIVMETGGMKGRREEMSKAAMHELLRGGFGVEQIHSEYGMTELLSQAYSLGDGLFRPAATMKVLTTEINDPLTLAAKGKVGVINIIDLANVDSCSFICTDDLGICYENGSFEILGRLDSSELRGCNLMLSDL